MVWLLLLLACGADEPMPHHVATTATTEPTATAGCELAGVYRIADHACATASTADTGSTGDTFTGTVRIEGQGACDLTIRTVQDGSPACSVEQVVRLQQQDGAWMWVDLELNQAAACPGTTRRNTDWQPVDVAGLELRFVGELGALPGCADPAIVLDLL